MYTVHSMCVCVCVCVFVCVFCHSPSVVLWLACLPLDSRLAGSNQSEDNGFLRGTKIRSKTSFGGEVKLSVHVVRFYGMLKNPTNVKEIHRRKNSGDISRQVSPASLLDICVGDCQQALVDESGIRTQLGTHSRSEMIAIQVSSCALTP
jgi:hypothetical protein